MDFELTEEQQLLKAAVREFAAGEIAPGAADRDEHARFPSELIPKLAEQGLLGIVVPEEYGGSGPREKWPVTVRGLSRSRPAGVPSAPC